MPQTRINAGFTKHFCLLKLSVFFVILNYIRLNFMQIHTRFYFNYIIYYGLLIFCCQNVAISIVVHNTLSSNTKIIFLQITSAQKTNETLYSKIYIFTIQNIFKSTLTFSNIFSDFISI